jgi:hypothetical protein
MSNMLNACNSSAAVVEARSCDGALGLKLSLCRLGSSHHVILAQVCSLSEFVVNIGKGRGSSTNLVADMTRWLKYQPVQEI